MVSKYGHGHVWRGRRRKTARAKQLRAVPWCERCRVEGRDTTATEVHHIVTIAKRPDLAFDPANLMSVCRYCHTLIHNRKMRRAVRAGKLLPSTFVRGRSPAA